MISVKVKYEISWGSNYSKIAQKMQRLQIKSYDGRETLQTMHRMHLKSNYIYRFTCTYLSLPLSESILLSNLRKLPNAHSS